MLNIEERKRTTTIDLKVTDTKWNTKQQNEATQNQTIQARIEKEPKKSKRKVAKLGEFALECKHVHKSVKTNEAQCGGRTE